LVFDFLSRTRSAASVLRRFRDTACLLLGLLAFAGIARAQPADTVLINGKVVIYDAEPAQALAVREGKIVAIGR
jgi:hypothetical protein